ncbi:uncharacterized protein ALTATR162_LOCUS6574 [Alternaria atra]|uniref:Dolichol phosphate-mannose biosynthesis regulatory protein n=1 Tax=Alternaria atra TaxID=119953 RepID=A0A8J2I3S4_9PLEO|nr:uncharacterized protein ALTATR162_LOCUS6574 [Alternaria atra]CAG5163900.1 unnamed protein product [Alternaria atra]
MVPPVTTKAFFLTLFTSVTASPLAKRDDYAIPPTVIVLLIMLGAGLVVCVGFAVNATFGFKETANGIKPMSQEQQEYMAEVRVMNMNALMAAGASSHRGGLKRGEVVYD